ncbi:MAG TPA: chemotaxis protein CheB, partial [Edaphobacter sp.]|nr:chemotaxis protein CheB [Edaphobacter sp.]
MIRNKPPPAEVPPPKEDAISPLGGSPGADGDGTEKVKSNPFLIAALGASAGGLEAFENFFKHMPADSGIAFVIVQHLAPDHVSALAELLGRHTLMAVTEVRDNTQVAPNCVYIIPPNATLKIKNATLRVTTPAEPHGRRTPIDSLFSSLAEDREENAVCIMLSGTGTDGTVGLRAIKEHGGMAMAQSLESAKYDAMLRSAIGTGLVDHVLPVEEMPAKLLEYAAHLSSVNGNGASSRIHEQIGERLSKIYALLRRRAGHDFSQYKSNTFIRRLERRMKTLQIESVEQYVQLLERQPEETDKLFNDLLIGVTQFFRDPEAFEILSREVIPQLFEGKEADSPVRVCVVGCASGEEAYSIAILLCEHAATLENAPRLQIFATDIDERGLEIARKGRYPESVAEHVSAERLKRFFSKQDGAYHVNKNLREICIFSNHSFIKDPPFSRLDLISCRTVMIYLGLDLQQKIIPLFHYALRSGGFLFLGPSESTSSHQDLFGAIDKKHRIFHRRESLLRPAVKFPLAEISRPRRPGDNQPEVEVPNLPKQLERVILKRHGPACVIVKANGDAVYFSGPISRYLEFPTGSPDTNVVNMAREGIGIPLRTSLHRAVTAREPSVHKQISIQMDGGVCHIGLTVEILTEFPDANLYMITFEEASTGSPEHGDPTASGGGSEEVIQQLESELRSAQELAQATCEELETSNEELQSANEEYQSTNEELESSKEELQSFNEELETVNSELNRKVTELDQTNSYLQNLLNSTQVATIFLDSELHIKNFTPAAGSVFRLIPSDVGRPITDLAAQFADADLVEDIKEVLRTLATRERDLAGAQGR